MHGAAGGAGARRPTGPRRRPPCSRWLMPSAATRRALVLLLAVAAVLSSSNSGFLRGLANASQALGGVSSAAGDLVGAGANMTVKFTTISLEAVSTAQHAAAEFYSGVDVLDIKIHRSTLRCISFSQSALSIWLANRSEFPNDVRDRFVQDLMSLSADVPVIEVSHEHILLNGSFVQSWVRGRRRCDDSVALALIVLVSEFSARWTSPHWDWWASMCNQKPGRSWKS